jgi:hypothetical protein
MTNETDTSFVSRGFRAGDRMRTPIRPGCLPAST